MALARGSLTTSLLTRNIYKPGISKTYRTGNFFTTGKLYPDSETKGFIIFKTKELPKALTYKDPFGNEVS
jgi:hypothetical protein